MPLVSARIPSSLVNELVLLCLSSTTIAWLTLMLAHRLPNPFSSEGNSSCVHRMGSFLDSSIRSICVGATTHEFK